MFTHNIMARVPAPEGAYVVFRLRGGEGIRAYLYPSPFGMMALTGDPATVPGDTQVPLDQVPGIRNILDGISDFDAAMEAAAEERAAPAPLTGMPMSVEGSAEMAELGEGAALL
jgi:hypothetical protein